MISRTLAYVNSTLNSPVSIESEKSLPFWSPLEIGLNFEVTLIWVSKIGWLLSIGVDFFPDPFASEEEVLLFPDTDVLLGFEDELWSFLSLRISSISEIVLARINQYSLLAKIPVL